MKSGTQLPGGYLSQLLQACMLALFLTGCQSPGVVPVAHHKENIDRLLVLIEQRLDVAPMVARAKWNSGAPIDDPVREQQILDGLMQTLDAGGKFDGELRVLLCRRAIEPRLGYWTLPAGFMENDETTSDAASRETEEEAGARVQLHELFSLINVPHVHQVHLFYRATLLDLDYMAGIESLEVAMFTEAEIPWSEIAFPTIEYTLRAFFADAKKVAAEGGSFSLHTQDIRRSMLRPE